MKNGNNKGIKNNICKICIERSKFWNEIMF